jgi:hypothetical protein
MRAFAVVAGLIGLFGLQQAPFILRGTIHVASFGRPHHLTNGTGWKSNGRQRSQRSTFSIHQERLISLSLTKGLAGRPPLHKYHWTKSSTLED